MRGWGDFLHFFLHFRFYCGKIGAEPPKNHIYVVSFGGHGTIAQLVEQMTFNHWVQGSSPCGPTTNKKSPNGGVFYLWHGQVDENPWVRHDSWQEQALLRAVRALRVERVPVAAIVFNKNCLSSPDYLLVEFKHRRRRTLFLAAFAAVFLSF